jgi:hypothetical protein
MPMIPVTPWQLSSQRYLRQMEYHRFAAERSLGSCYKGFYQWPRAELAPLLLTPVYPPSERQKIAGRQREQS